MCDNQHPPNRKGGSNESCATLAAMSTPVNVYGDCMRDAPYCVKADAKLGAEISTTKTDRDLGIKLDEFIAKNEQD
uniref:Uncharacterized protein n=1 Tax=Romanomermis culicivorax TaxID=13658 RepID=A0A915IGV3_ROMCU